jgi:hypothetical protein
MDWRCGSSTRESALQATVLPKKKEYIFKILFMKPSFRGQCFYFNAAVSSRSCPYSCMVWASPHSQAMGRLLKALLLSCFPQTHSHLAMLSPFPHSKVGTILPSWPGAGGMTSVILASWEAKIRRIVVPGQLGWKEPQKTPSEQKKR